MDAVSYAFRFRTQTGGGTGIFSKSDEIALPHNPSFLNTGDFNLDDNEDLIATSGYSVENWYHTNNWISISFLRNYSKIDFVLEPSQDFLTPMGGSASGYSLMDQVLLDCDLIVF